MLFYRLPRVVGGGAALPAYQEVGPVAAEGRAVEKLLHHLRPRKTRSGSLVGRITPGCERVVGFEPVDVDRGTALEAARQGGRLAPPPQRFPPTRAQLAHPCSVKQLHGPQHHLLAHLYVQIFYWALVVLNYFYFIFMHPFNHNTEEKEKNHRISSSFLFFS